VPTSNPDAVSFVAAAILKADPKSVLDVGIGFGKYGFLAREYSDVCRLRYFAWETQVDGIEIFKKYIGNIQRSIYNNIYIGDALDVLKESYTDMEYAIRPLLPYYDILICSDMLEHLKPTAGYEFLELCKMRAKQSIIIVPQNPSKQQPHYGNEHERHLSGYTKNFLLKYGPTLEIGTQYVTIING
jgi:2-polyprenyl-3-methyl-5-hydroxy-6-metoxy-1,4-benzoquinol methylase